MLMEAHTSLCRDAWASQSLMHKPGACVAESYKSSTLGFHIPCGCGCTSKHFYQQVFVVERGLRRVMERVT